MIENRVSLRDVDFSDRREWVAEASDSKTVKRSLARKVRDVLVD